jgi:hypothetical protein
MLRLLPICVLVLMPAVGRAQGEPQPTETVVRLTVQPAAAPKPALRYLLLPELREMNPGNPILGYLKSFMEQNSFYYNKDRVEQREKWATMPLKDLPVKELRAYGGVALTMADEAARLTDPNWQTLIPLRRDGISLLVPEVQKMRSIAVALGVRLRGEIADRRLDDAIVTAKTMLALARHLGEHPTLIGGLVGIAIAAQALDPLEEMIGQPGCPNLYWALTDLPSPLIDMRKGHQGERIILASEFSELDDHAPMSAERVARAIARTQEILNVTAPPKGPARDAKVWLDSCVKKEGHVDGARKRLIDFGLPANSVAQFPPRQIILLDEKLKYEILRDHTTKVAGLPFWQAEAALAADPPAKQGADDGLYTPFVPASHRVRQAQARIDQRVAMLRCLEALRLHAADHDGKPPAKLADVRVPVPVDPFTGQPFLYTFENGIATLRGSPPAGQEKSAAYNIRYEIKIAK